MGKHFDLRLTSILLGLLILNRLTSSSILLSLSGLQLAQDQPGSYSHACMRAKFTTTERNNLLSKALHIGAEGRNIKRRRHRRAVIDLKTGATFTTKHKLVMNMHFYVCVCAAEKPQRLSHGWPRTLGQSHHHNHPRLHCRAPPLNPWVL